MGGCLSRRNGVHLVMLGLDSAGKTTALYRLHLDQYIATAPTIGFNYEKVRIAEKDSPVHGVAFVIWDVGGQDKVRPLWRSYTRATDGILFVVDSRDAERLEEAKVELLKVARVPETLGVPIVVVANKQDLPGSRSPEEIQTVLNASELTGRQWAVHAACAVTGEGLNESIEHLYEMIVKRRRSTKQSKRRR